MSETEQPLAPTLQAGTPSRESRVPKFLRKPGGVFGAGWLVFMVVASLTAPWWRPYDVAEQDLFSRLQGPSSEYWLGTDPVGRDLFSRIFTAGSLPLLASLLMVCVAMGIGLPLALVAAERGGRFETFASRWAEMIMSLPGTVVLLAAIGAFGSRTYLVMIVLGVLISAPTYRIFLGVAQSARQRLYVDAARVNGLSSLQVNVSHILPGMLRVIAVQAAQFFGIGLIVIAGLAFLGFGPAEPTPSWGFMIAEASKNVFTSPWLLVPAGTALALTVIAANLLADALSENDGGAVVTPAKKRKALRYTPPAPSSLSEDPGNVLSVSGLSVSVADGPMLVSDVSFSVAAGQVLGLVGESGCGKTMTARSILGLLPDGVGPSAGSIRWKGRELLGLAEREFRSIRGSELALISQEPMVALDPLFSVQYQLTRPIRRLRGVGRAEAKRIAVELLEKVGIVDIDRVLKTYPHQLSGGMAQRISIALALAGEPELLIADEPTTALDVTVQAEILSLLRDLVRTTGLSVVLVSHDLGVVADICDTVAVMYAGEVVESGPTEDVLGNAVHPYTRALLTANPHVPEDVAVPDRLASISGTVPPPGQWPIGCRFASRCDFAKAACLDEIETAPRPGSGITRCIRSAEIAAAGDVLDLRTDGTAMATEGVS